MQFFVGMHHPHQAHRVPRAFVSVNALWKRKSAFAAWDWIMDSGAFTEISAHGRYRHSVEVYAEEIRRWAGNGNLLAAVAQDFMCEPFILEKTGGTVGGHQWSTVERYEALIDERPGVYVMPVLQGWSPADYTRHVEMYGEMLPADAWVGVGSVCKRNSDPGAVVAILEGILSRRPDLRLHGFGLKTTALGLAEVRDRLYSADSMAWSFAARYEGRNGNCWREALAFYQRVMSMPVQPDLFTTQHRQDVI